MNQYVNPKICVHRIVGFYFMKGAMFARCDTCELSGPHVQVGLFHWWARSRAARGFYKLALQVDCEGELN